MSETLSSFWKKLQLGTKIKVVYTDHYRNKHGEALGEIVKVQTNAVARSGPNTHDPTKAAYTKEKPCYFRKPKALDCKVWNNKIMIHSKRCSTTVIYEILENEK